MRALKMKIFAKYLKLLRTGLLLCHLLTVIGISAGGIDEVQAQKLGNFLDNAFANMNDEEKELFMQEVQREQEKLMAMSPEERAAREEQVARELDQLMNNSPYAEWFEKPANPVTLPEPVTPVEEVATPAPQTPTAEKANTKSKPKPKPATISKDQKDQSKKTIQSIVQAIDAILLKTNNMMQIHHPVWNHGKWLQLSHDLQALKSELQMIVNSDQTLADLLSKEQVKLREDIQNLEKILAQSASQLKTPDAMGLVVVFEGQPKIIDQARYDEAVLKLKSIIDLINLQFNQTNFMSNIKNLLAKHAPMGNQNKIDGKKLATQKNSANVSSKTCKPGPDRDLTLKQIKTLVTELKRCTNQQLLDLAISYQKNPSVSTQRKLQWKLSELELHLGKLVRSINLLPNCKADVQLLLDQAHDEHEMIHQILDVLNSIQSTQELNALIKQIDSHIITLKL